MIDSTAIPLDTVTELIVITARAHEARIPGAQQDSLGHDGH